MNTQDASRVDPITQKWWNMMADLMDTNKDNSPVSVPLKELFHLE
jgi:L-rhamnose mutarotase